MLKKKLEDFAKDLDANEKRIMSINQQADTLEVEGHPDIQVIREKQSEVNEAWDKLHQLVTLRRTILTSSHEIHAYYRYVFIENFFLYLHNLP